VYERTYKIRVFDPNRILVIKGKEVRTPTEAVVSESELNIIKASLTSSGSKNFVVESMDEKFLYSFPEVFNQEAIESTKKVHIPTYEEVKTRLTTKKIVFPKVTRKSRISGVEPVLKDRVKISSPKTSFYIPTELQRDGKNLLLINVPVVKQDFEVKIEDLKVESSNILKKFLREKTE